VKRNDGGKKSSVTVVSTCGVKNKSWPRNHFWRWHQGSKEITPAMSYMLLIRTRYTTFLICQVRVHSSHYAAQFSSQSCMSTSFYQIEARLHEQALIKKGHWLGSKHGCSAVTATFPTIPVYDSLQFENKSLDKLQKFIRIILIILSFVQEVRGLTGGTILAAWERKVSVFLFCPYPSLKQEIVPKSRTRN